MGVSHKHIEKYANSTSTSKRDAERMYRRNYKKEPIRVGKKQGVATHIYGMHTFFGVEGPLQFTYFDLSGHFLWDPK